MIKQPPREPEVIGTPGQYYSLKYHSDGEVVILHYDDAARTLGIGAGTLYQYLIGSRGKELQRVVKHRSVEGAFEKVTVSRTNRVRQGRPPTKVHEPKGAVGRPRNDPTQHTTPKEEDLSFMRSIPKSKREKYLAGNPRLAARLASYNKNE